MPIWFLILLAVVAAAGFLAMGRLDGAARSGAKSLLLMVVVLALAAIFGVVGLGDAVT